MSRYRAAARSAARDDAADAVPGAPRGPAVGRHEAEAGAGLHARARAAGAAARRADDRRRPVSRREFWKLLSEFVSSGLTIVMATPYLDEAERCARVALLHDGRLLAVDAPDALRGRLGGQMLEVIDRHAAAADRMRWPRCPASRTSSRSASAHTSGSTRTDAGQAASIRSRLGGSGHPRDRVAGGRRLARRRVHRSDHTEGRRPDGGRTQVTARMPMRTPPALVMLFLSTSTLAVAGQAPSAAPSTPLTLDEAIARGLANSQRLAELEARSAAAAAVEQGRAPRRSPADRVADRRLHPHQPRHRVRDSERPAGRRR